MKLILIPGMDGTGDLFEPLLRALGERVETLVLPLPSDGTQSQISLAKRLAPDLPDDEPYFLLGESFGGRIAFEIALTQPPHLKGVIYAASFLMPPKPLLLPLAATLPLARMIKYPPASGAAKHMMLGRRAPTMWPIIRETIASVRAGLISDRLAALCEVAAPAGVSDMPSMHLRPTRDRLVDGKAADSIGANCSNLKTVTIDGPHFLLQAQPEKCAEEIMAFMTSTR